MIGNPKRPSNWFVRLLAALTALIRQGFRHFSEWIRFRSHTLRRQSAPAIDLDAQLARQAASSFRTRRKPPWVEREVIRLRALGYGLGYAKITEVFNRKQAHRGERVSKSTVQRIVNRNREAITALRRNKHRVPWPTRKNAIWGMDLCTVTDATFRQRLVLGVVDHGVRACITLTELRDKSSLTILRELIPLFRRFGLPKRLRVDNDATMKSRLMRAALSMLGVTLQTTDPGCPWQNGRIGRFFGTFKAAIRRIVVQPENLPTRLMQFRAFYNFARTHQHLSGRTPAEAWSGGSRKAIGDGEFMTAWRGVLNGWYFPMRE